MENITLTKTYEDGIIDALNILRRYTDVGVYNVPTKYIEEALIKLLPNVHEIDITKDQNKSLENVDNV